MKSKTNSVQETCIHSVSKAVEANRQRLLSIMKATLLMPGRIFLFSLEMMQTIMARKAIATFMLFFTLKHCILWVEKQYEVTR